MMNLKEKKIINIIFKNKDISSSGVFAELLKVGEKTSLVTVKRLLSKMVALGFLNTSGAGRSVVYNINDLGRVFIEIDAKEYCSFDLNERYGLTQFNFNLFDSLKEDVFNIDEIKELEKNNKEYKERTKGLSSTIQKKELERFLIELSWKSSKIEGNTYTLIDTAKLILENKRAESKTEIEAQMILNHKNAFNFIYNNRAQFKILTKKNIEDLHRILTKDLDISSGIRKDMVGIAGSIYKPLDNKYQINDALESLIKTVARIKNPYEKAFISLLGISYIQPFSDGNKRTSRFIANAILLAHNFLPLSYRNVNEDDYREAILVFYEINSVMPFKKIFLSECAFSAKNYSIG
ncbi:MAG: Fic family protein [Candidatus Pacebacteria bacterium]|nr:Fic family protein [Candidatus Paceibacterota bacterium]